MHRVVVDTGVLISAFISPGGSAPDRIVRAWHQGAFELLVSPKLIAEMTKVLSRPKFKKQAAEGRAEAYVKIFVSGAIRIDDAPNPAPITTDPDDDYLFALAKAGTADLIVSGDKHLTEVKNPEPPVLTPRQFVERVLEPGDKLRIETPELPTTN